MPNEIATKIGLFRLNAINDFVQFGRLCTFFEGVCKFAEFGTIGGK